MKKVAILFVIILLTNNLFSQIKDKAYNEMLDNLLSHTVTEVQVDNIDEKDTSIFYLDAREKNEYEVSHLKNAIWVGYNNFNIERVHQLDKNKKIVVYCSVGYRSEKVAEKLIKAGYNNVSNLYGSIFEWVNQDKPIYDKNGIPTKKIHAYNPEWGVWLKKGEKIYN